MKKIFDVAKKTLFAKKQSQKAQHSNNIKFTRFLKAGATERALPFISEIDPYFTDPETNKKILNLAVERNNPTIVEKLLQLTPVLSDEDQDGNTALMTAVSLNHQKIIKLLIEMPTENKISHANNEGLTALDLALQIGKTKVAMYLIDNKCDMVPALLNSIASEDLGQCEWLVTHGASINIVDHSGHSPLVHSILNEDIDAFNLWIKLNADINDKKGNGRELINQSKTPYMMAITHNKLDFAQHILDTKMFDPNIKDSEGSNAIYWSAKSGQVALLAQALTIKGSNIESKANGTTILMDACSRNDVSMASYILKAKLVDIDAADNKNWTALIYAVHGGFIDCVKLLLNYPVNLSTKTIKHNFTAQDVAQNHIASLTDFESDLRATFSKIIELIQQKSK